MNLGVVKAAKLALAALWKKELCKQAKRFEDKDFMQQKEQVGASWALKFTKKV